MATHSSPVLPLVTQPLSAASFAPFGDVIEASETAKAVAINDGTCRRYHALSTIDVVAGDTIVSIFRAQPCAMPLVVSRLERHPLSSQTFVPQSGLPWIAVAALGDDVPAPETLAAFVCQPHQGLTYRRGVWHHALIALRETSDFLVVDRLGAGNNCETAALDRPYALSWAAI